ncbi:mRNA interferase PemK [Gluconobacter sphaericus NBRC 12467]|uniref:mRNA interferase PemK n=1 Tax=Gluconobacter sphaericus NBRC 12467 TaxID=1307951 RepID=A0AA37WD59_9PROT|nr:type II toxin-antitoxin system PemK/MazF family toxin [Gluconobacter sphaericus]GEB44041.1 mRNA interferase PemK [Gluconobacter sphaericus NBRC 12467]GLQ85749.1 mRNA interferase PemK [Gluconobacter sphaericus NBRC 12467]
MNWGDFVTVALQGDLGKPRSALIVQADRFETTASVSILPVTSALIDAVLLRLSVTPDERSGLRKTSQLMIDKPSTVSRDKIGPTVGIASDTVMLSVNRPVMLFLGLA